MNPERIIRKLRGNPRQSLDAARRGSLLDLTEIANFWQEVPEMLSLGILGMFFDHLDLSKAPNTLDPPANNSPSLSKASLSLLGLTKSGDYIGEGGEYTQQIIEAWPGIFKWSAYLFTVRVDAPSAITAPELRRGSIDTIAGSWYSISRDDSVRKEMVATPGSIEIATRLWMLEDSPSLPPTIMDIPSCSAALANLLRDTNSETLSRVVESAGGQASKVAQTVLSRFNAAISKSPINNGNPATVFADLMSGLSRSPDHPLRHALLSANAITSVTKALVSISQQLNATGNPTLLDTMVASFIFLSNCLESTDGFSWITQSLRAGLLTALVDCSPHYSKVDSEDRDAIFEIITKILPRYFVYRSVIEAVEVGVSKVQKSPHRERIQNSMAKDIWAEFHELAFGRLVATVEASVMKGKGATCDNAKCHKVDTKKKFRRCAACHTTLYCSKECQTTAWKEGDYKTVCIMKQRERLEGKKEAFSNKDVAFFHYLAIRDAKLHLPILRESASEFPGANLTDLIIRVDYTVLPEKYTVEPIAGYVRPATCGSSNAEARSDAILEKGKSNPGMYALIESTIANGPLNTIVMTIVTADFWDSKGPLSIDLSMAFAEPGAAGYDPDEESSGMIAVADRAVSERTRRIRNRFMHKSGDEDNV